MSSERIDLGFAPRPWQREASMGLRNKRWGVLVCHRRAGKTLLAVLHLIDRALRCDRPSPRYAYIAPYLKQAKAIAWSYLRQYACRIPGTVVNEAELHVTLANGAQIRIYGGENADGLRGIYLDGVVLDEVADLSSDLWDSVLRPALSDRHGWAILMGTPNGINLLSERYFAAEGKPDWYRGLYAVDQTQALPAEEVAALRDEMTENAFAREFLCDFSASAADALLSVSDVERASRRHYREDEYSGAAKVLGVDVARQGDDRSVIIRRQGPAAFPPEVFRGLDAMRVAGHVANHIIEWEPDAVFIDGTGGYGAGVVDRLRQLRHRVIEVQFAGEPLDKRFANKRAEMWWKMAEWVRACGHIPPSPELRQDLCAPTYEQDARDRLLLESKDKIKARGLPSPDLGDALALTFAFPVQARALREALHREVEIDRRPFDPLGRVRHYA